MRKRLALGLRGKLLLAFGAVLLPALALLLIEFRAGLDERREGVLRDQLASARAIAIQVHEAFGGALGVAWAVAAHPQVRAFDPDVGPTLASIARGQPGGWAIDLYDAAGNRVGGSGPRRGAGEDRADETVWFRRTIGTNGPTVSDVRVLRSGAIGLVVSVPVRGPEDEPRGVLAVELPASELARHYDETRLRPGQAILLADARGRAAFTTLERDLRYDAAARFAGVPALREALSGIPVAGTIDGLPLTHGPQLAAFAPTPQYGWAVGVTTPVDVAMAPAVRRFRRSMALFGVVVLLSVVLARALSRTLTAPVRRLEEGARAIGAGDLSRRVEIRSGDELQRLGETFNEMAARLQQSYEEVRTALKVREEFMAAAAHELRTPVTTIRTWAQVLLRRDPGAETQRHALTAIERQTERIARLIDGLLLGLRLRTTAGMEVHREPADLARVLDRIVGSPAIAPFAPSLRVELERPLPVEIDPGLVTRALGDALEDAARQAAPGDLVELRALRVRDEARVAIRFAGVSLDPQRRAQYFEPLFEPVPPGQPGYVGRVSIGPYLNKLVIEAHGGRVWLETEGSATTLWASLPLTAAAA